MGFSPAPQIVQKKNCDLQGRRLHILTRKLQKNLLQTSFAPLLASFALSCGPVSLFPMVGRRGLFFETED